MSRKSSELMGLLKELSWIKELDEKYEGGDSSSKLDTAEFESRQNRRREIADQIKALRA
jgi:hypothetical protein